MAALPDTRMPGVITQEIPTLPPSIALVPSAVPCFIGYTEIAEKNGENLNLKPTRIINMREYEAWFGTSPNQSIELELREMFDDSDANNPKTVSLDIKVSSVGNFQYRMHYAMQLYYANGGGPCYIISVGLQSGGSVTEGDMEKGIEKAKLAKDITIFSFPDACNTLSDADYYTTLVASALQHCDKMKNRVLLIDVSDKNNDEATIKTNFRGLITQNINQKYGAAYYPRLNTTLDYQFEDTSVTIKSHHAFTNVILALEKPYLKAKAEHKVIADAKTIIDNIITGNAAATIQDLKDALGTSIPSEIQTELDKAGATAATVQTVVGTLANNAQTEETKKKTAFDTVQGKLEAAVKTKNANYFIADNTKLNADIIQKERNLLYNQIRQAIRDLPVPMPPSPAIAGIMVQTDATQGVWQAPANVGVAAVISPTVDIDDDFHANLNVDATSGKSINAIRAYEGRGILVFGARTLAGNDLEWRYISVRRTFCFIEDAIGRAMQSFVFAPNTRDTWIKVKAMISNFLVEIWKAGGLFGNTTNEAYQVNVGLPETMSDVDILEGRMIVEIKLRVSRPAEFIILRYEHKFQANAN